MQTQPDLTDFERTLRSVRPTPGRLDPLAAAFAAGQHSRRPQLLLWRTATCTALLLALAPQFLPRHTPGPAPIPPSFALQPATATPTPVSAQSALMLQQSVLHQGLAGLPATPLPDSPTRNAAPL